KGSGVARRRDGEPIRGQQCYGPIVGTCLQTCSEGAARGLPKGAVTHIGCLNHEIAGEFALDGEVGLIDAPGTAGLWTEQGRRSDDGPRGLACSRVIHIGPFDLNVWRKSLR